MNRDNILIEAEELKSIADNGNLRVYDVSIVVAAFGGDGTNQLTAQEKYLQGHIPGAAFFDHQNFSDRNGDYMFMVLPETELASSIGNLGITEDSEVIFYSTESIIWATRAWWILRYAGHDNVRILNGGLAAWQQSGGEIEQAARRYEATDYECKLRPNMIASKEDVQAAMEDDAVCTVNTLSHDDYTGSSDAYYAAQGHITGSVNHPCDDLLDGASFLANDELASRLDEKAPGEQIITYCGAGIAATVNAVAYLLVGQDNIAMYDGSMLEWMGEGLPTTNGDSPA